MKLWSLAMWFALLDGDAHWFYNLVTVYDFTYTNTGFYLLSSSQHRNDYTFAATLYSIGSTTRKEEEAFMHTMTMTIPRLEWMKQRVSTSVITESGFWLLLGWTSLLKLAVLYLNVVILNRSCTCMTTVGQPPQGLTKTWPQDCKQTASYSDVN